MWAALAGEPAVAGFMAALWVRMRREEKAAGGR